MKNTNLQTKETNLCIVFWHCAKKILIWKKNLFFFILFEYWATNYPSCAEQFLAGLSNRLSTCSQDLLTSSSKKRSFWSSPDLELKLFGNFSRKLRWICENCIPSVHRNNSKKKTSGKLCFFCHFLTLIKEFLAVCRQNFAWCVKIWLNMSLGAIWRKKCFFGKTNLSCHFLTVSTKFSAFCRQFFCWFVIFCLSVCKGTFCWKKIFIVKINFLSVSENEWRSSVRLKKKSRQCGENAFHQSIGNFWWKHLFCKIKFFKILFGHWATKSGLFLHIFFAGFSKINSTCPETDFDQEIFIAKFCFSDQCRTLSKNFSNFVDSFLATLSRFHSARPEEDFEEKVSSCKNYIFDPPVSDTQQKNFGFSSKKRYLGFYNSPFRVHSITLRKKPLGKFCLFRFFSLGKNSRLFSDKFLTRLSKLDSPCSLKQIDGKHKSSKKLVFISYSEILRKNLFFEKLFWFFITF